MARRSDSEVSDPRAQTSTREEDERKTISLGEYRSRRSAPQHPTSPEGRSCSEEDLTPADSSIGNKEIREKIARIDRQMREQAEERRRLQNLLQLRAKELQLRQMKKEVASLAATLQELKDPAENHPDDS
jgi:hypothetical protein